MSPAGKTLSPRPAVDPACSTRRMRRRTRAGGSARRPPWRDRPAEP